MMGRNVGTFTDARPTCAIAIMAKNIRAILIESGRNGRCDGGAKRDHRSASPVISIATIV